MKGKVHGLFGNTSPAGAWWACGEFTKYQLRQFVFQSGRTPGYQNKNALYRDVPACKRKSASAQSFIHRVSPHPAFPYCHYFLLIAKPLIPDRWYTNGRPKFWKEHRNLFGRN